MNLSPHAFTLRQLQYVVAVAEHRSFRRAAETCHVAQPSLSAQIAQLEDSLGVTLFERDHRNVTLTTAGEALMPAILSLLQSASSLGERARTLADPHSGTLRIAMIPTVGPYLLPELAPSLRKSFPKLTWIWSEEKTSALLAQLATNTIDAGVLALDDRSAGLPHVVLGDDAFLFAASPQHPLSQSKRPLKPEELDGENILLLDEGHCFRDQALSFCDRVGAIEAGFRATSLGTLVQIAASNAGVTLLPSLAVPIENRRNALRVRAFAPTVPTRTLILAWRRGSAVEPILRTIGEKLRSGYEALCDRMGDR